MKENEMAAVLQMAGFDAKDCLLAMAAAYGDALPGAAAGPLIQAGYSPAEVGQGLKAAAYLREDEIAESFFHCRCGAREAIEAIDGAYALRGELAAEIASRAGYPEPEIRAGLRELRAGRRRARPWYRDAEDLGHRVRTSLRFLRERLRPRCSPVKLYVYDVPEDLLYLRRESLAEPYFEALESAEVPPPLRFDLSRRMLEKHYFSEAATRDWTQQYGYEYVLTRELTQAGPLVTRDPKKADFFLIPHFTTTIFAKLLKNVEFLTFRSDTFVREHWPRILAVANRYLRAILDHVSREHPWFDRSGGRDHLLLATWDNGIGIAEPRDSNAYAVSHMFEAETLRLLREVIQVTHHGNRSLRYFRTHPSVIIPPYLNDHLVRRIRADPRSRDFSREQRSILSFCLGSASHHPMREVYERCYRDDPDMLTNAPILKSDRFDDLRLSCRFSICLEGFTPWTMRLSQAFLFGCIPVIVSDKVMLPFERQIDWDACAVRVSPGEIPALKQKLQSMPAAETERLQRGLVEQADRILFDSRRPLFEQGLGAAIVDELRHLRRERGGRSARPGRTLGGPLGWVSRVAS